MGAGLSGLGLSGPDQFYMAPQLWLETFGIGLRCSQVVLGGGEGDRHLVYASSPQGRNFKPPWNGSRKPTRMLHAAAVALALTS